MQRKILLFLSCLLYIALAYADDKPIDLTKIYPKCGSFSIKDDSSRKEINKNCTVVDSHNWRVRVFRGTETIDLKTSNMGEISCKFSRSLVNTDGTIRKCWKKIPATTT